ncbi:MULTISPECIES: diguanylate cyclase [Acinetobacter Taxon 24D]|uniref:diguanylate cyclase n=1 Tax=Acinetobacter Taxon 24D TaxID=2839057 RepID=UPI00103C65A2|nr:MULTISPECIES: diguanylate cyclase [Acinetobacter Taxon 24D]NNG81507.1 diguanylate cyclase [Acinetobacter sp. ANC 5378]TCH65725.1 diguanylate cyclase [Acinetobacter sp. ANC 4862]
MNNECMAMLAEQWEHICQNYSSDDLLHAFQFIQDHSLILVEEFYKKMLVEKESAEFFSDDLIQQRLLNTLNAWLLESFSVGINKRYSEAVQKQHKVGHVHARVGIPSWLIMRGICEIERKVFELVAQNPQQDMFTVCSYIVQIMGFSTEIMCRSYEFNLEKNNDIKHTYRLFSAMQDVASQKDKQRSSLLNWENELMFKVFSDELKFTHPLLSKSEFGLWFIHKAAYAFTGSEQVSVIIDRIYQIDLLSQQVLNAIEKDKAIQLIQDIRENNREIQHLVDQLFQVADYIDSGSDSLTQLLNRRYLNTIVSREINFSRKNNTPLSLLAIDADFFKRINDKFGHAAGDLALQFIGEVLLESVQGSDYAFRVGGEEFLLLLVDSDLGRAQEIAENIRRCIQETTIRTTMGSSFNFTVSIGCALYDGHPDYQKFLDTADTALYAAKNSGRNRVYLAQNELQVAVANTPESVQL